MIIKNLNLTVLLGGRALYVPYLNFNVTESKKKNFLILLK